MIDINDPKIRWAQFIADKSGETQLVMQNAIGGLDIKRERFVSQIHNLSIIARIEPKFTRLQNATN